MRFSRFKQQMEGTTSTPRVARPKKNGSKTTDKDNPKAGLQKEPISPPPSGLGIKQEHETTTAYDPHQSPYIKTDPYMQRIPTLEHIPQAEGRESMAPGVMQPVAPQPHAQQLMYPQQHRLPQHPLRQPRPQFHHRYQQHYPLPSYNPYHSPMTVAPADLSMHSAAPQFGPSLNWGFEKPSGLPSLWTPVKHEGEENGALHSEPLKLEGPEQ